MPHISNYNPSFSNEPRRKKSRNYDREDRILKRLYDVIQFTHNPSVTDYLKHSQIEAHSPEEALNKHLKQDPVTSKFRLVWFSFGQEMVYRKKKLDHWAYIIDRRTGRTSRFGILFFQPRVS